MPDVIEQLRRYGEAAEAAVPAASVPAPRDRRPWLLAAAALVLVACVGAAVWVLQADGEGAGPAVETIEQPPEAATGWTTLDPGPLDPREGSAVVWTGEELVVWGGTRTGDGVGFADGAAYDPATGEWRTMSPAPGGRGGLAAGVWSGEEVLLWGAEIGGVAADELPPGTVLAWDPADDTWRRAGGRCEPAADRCLAAAGARPWGTGVLEPFWTGAEAIDTGTGLAYDPTADIWRRLPDRPIEGTAQAATWTGEELIVMVANRSDPSYPAGEAVALAYDPDADAWEALGSTGVGETAVDVAWDGEQLVALDHEMQASTWRPGDDEWDPLPPLPMRFYECSPQLAPVAGTAYARHCSGEALLTEDREWAIAPPADDAWGVLVPTDDALLSWWSSDYYGDPPGSALQAYRPPALPEGDLAIERTVPIGTVLLDLPDGARLVDTAWSEGAGGLVTHLGFEVDLGEGVACTLESSYASILSEVRIRNDASTVDATLDRIPLDGVDVDRDEALVARFPAGALDDRAHILLEESTSDVLDLACPTLPTANALLARLHR